MQHTQEYKTLLGLPGNVLMSLWRHVFPGLDFPRNGDGKPSKSGILNRMTPAFLDGSKSLSDALVTVGHLPPATVGHLPPAPAVSKDDFVAAAGLAQRAIDQTITLSNDLAHLNRAIATQANSLNSFGQTLGSINTDLTISRNDINNIAGNVSAINKTVADAVQTLRDDVAREISKSQSFTIDPSEIAAAVTAAVASEFGKFKSAIENIPGAADVIGDMIAGSENITVKPCKDIFGKDVTDAGGNTLKFKSVGNVSAPAPDGYFIWQPDIIRVMNLADSDNGQSFLSNIWAGGEKGTGKTETAKQFAARTGRPYFRVNFQKFTMLEDICGAVGLKNGNTEFTPGILLTAWSTPYAVINLDELSIADPGVLGFFNGLLEPGSVISYGGRQWKRAPGVIVIASDNTLGSGDTTGRYSGTRSQSAALIDRFGLMVHFDYLPKAEEIKAIVKHTGCHADLAAHVVNAVGVARSKVSTGEIIDAPSIRSVVSFIKALRVLNVKDAWNMTIAARQPAESAVALQAIFDSSVDQKLIKSLI